MCNVYGGAVTIPPNCLPVIIEDPVAPMMERDYLALARNHIAAVLKHADEAKTSGSVALITTPFHVDDFSATYERLIRESEAP